MAQFPNAIYLDAMDASGAIRIGTELFGPPPPKESAAGERAAVPKAKPGLNTLTNGYGYAVTMLRGYVFMCESLK